MTIPNRITDEARRLHAVAHRNYKEDTIAIFSHALNAIDLAAEQRGREMEREEVAEIAASIERAARALRIGKAQTQPDHCAYHLHEEQTAGHIAKLIRSRTTEG